VNELKDVKVFEENGNYYITTNVKNIEIEKRIEGSDKVESLMLKRDNEDSKMGLIRIVKDDSDVWNVSVKKNLGVSGVYEVYQSYVLYFQD